VSYFLYKNVEALSFLSVQHVIHLNGFSSTHLARTAPGL
jgi:hypothetical protein